MRQGWKPRGRNRLRVRFTTARPRPFARGRPLIVFTSCNTAGRAGETSGRLDTGSWCSLSVLTPIETLKDALSAGWRVHARCIDGKVDNTRSTAKCHYRAELDLETLVWTRGPHMSLAGLNDRMMCPRCGNRRVNLIFEPPTIAGRAQA